MHSLEELKCFRCRQKLREYDGQFVTYRIINIDSNKTYIGSSTRIRTRVKEHIRYSLESENPCRSLVHKAISKHGFDRFTFEILSVEETHEALERSEQELIIKYNSMAPLGYNLTKGGRQGQISEKTRLKKIESSNKTKIARYSPEGDFLEAYPSVKEAARKLGLKDTDLHRSCKKKYSCAGFLFDKFKIEPLKKIAPHKSNSGINLKNGNYAGQNAIPAKLTNLQTGKTFEGKSFTELANKAGLYKGAINRIKNHKNHKKWKLEILK